VIDAYPLLYFFPKPVFVVTGGVIGLFVAYYKINSYRNSMLIMLRYFLIIVVVFIFWIVIKEDFSSDFSPFWLHFVQLGIATIALVKFRLFLKYSTFWIIRFVVLSGFIVFVFSHLGYEFSEPWGRSVDAFFTGEDNEPWMTSMVPSKDWIGKIFALLSSFSFIKIIWQFFSNKKRKEARERDRIQIQTLARSTSISQVLSEVTDAVLSPVNSIKVDSELASDFLKKSECSHEVDNKLDSVLNYTSQCFDVIGKIGNISPKKELKKDRVLVNKSIEKVVRLLRGKLKRNNIALRISVDKANPSVHLNTLELERVLLNLSNNSIKAMTDNARTKNKLTITSQTSGDTVEIMVEDTGAEILNTEEMFNFFKEARQYNYNDGLGLSLCLNRKTIESCQGSLKLLSTSEKGSKFVIELPKYIQNNVKK
jgi:signal transduction histidine kinase